MSTPNPATSPWVPLWDLNGAVDLRYDGAYVPAQQYSDGEIVVYQGTAWLCVRPTTNPPALWSALPAGPTYGTTLPASPNNGQEAILVDSLTNPSYQWRFRYNANSTSAYKWEFIGGAPKIFNYDQGGALMSNAAFTQSGSSRWWVNAAGTIFLVPRSGDYRVFCKQQIGNFGASGATAYLWATSFPTSTTISNTAAQQTYVGVAASANSMNMTGALITGVTAGTAYVGMAFWGDNSNNFAIGAVYIEIAPSRVS